MALDLSVVGQPTKAAVFTYSWKDVVLYALGIGAKQSELDYLFEGRGPKVYPSFAVVPTFSVVFDVLRRTGGNLAMVVHGGQKVRVHKPFAPSGTLHTTGVVRGIYDMKKFASAVIDTETKDEHGEPVCTTSWSIIFRGEGGFNGEPPPRDEKTITVPKDRAPDFRIEEATTPEQALLYRLSGDLNPLHADPKFAAEVGFTQGPILHGLCTYGHMVRHVVKGACGGDATKLESFEGQFRKPVWPGDTICTSGWIVDGGVALQVTIKERENEIVLGAANATTRA